MDAKSIGHEFVRQYYTLVHDDPEVLHRFYLDKSTFVHASESTPEDGAVGQKAIYDRIKKLNFVDCRARVRQVDSHQSISGSILVQVVGELSNNSEPMRPFVQTFVLVAETPTKYYVHNDILRFQDHIVATDLSEEVPATVSMPPQPAQTSNSVQTEPIDYYNQSTETLTNGVSMMSESSHAVGPGESSPESPSSVEVQSEPTIEPQPKALPAENGIVQEEQAPKPISWAERAGGKPSSMPSSPPAVEPIHAAANPTPAAAAAQGSSRQGQRSARRANNAAAAADAGARSTQANGRSPAAPTTNGPRPTTGRTTRDIPDNQQVFVGNLPDSAEPANIKKIFSEYGNVLDVRITPKRFGFVAFDSVESVETILRKAQTARASGEKPFELNGLRLNVEEKKAPKESSNRQSGSQPRGAGRSSNQPGRAGRSGRDGVRR